MVRRPCAGTCEGFRIRVRPILDDESHGDTCPDGVYSMVVCGHVRGAKPGPVQLQWNELGPRMTNRKIAFVLPDGTHVDGQLGVESEGLRLNVTKSSNPHAQPKGSTWWIAALVAPGNRVPQAGEIARHGRGIELASRIADARPAVRQKHNEVLRSGLAPGARETDHRARRIGTSAAYSMVRSLSRAAHFSSVLTLRSSRR